MKIITAILTLNLFALTTLGQTNYKGHPLLKANSVLADYRIGNDWVKGSWTISPHLEFDSLYHSYFHGLIGTYK